MPSPPPASAARPVTRVAMWSGPRTISTALMRSWGSRADTAVVDEPFYAHYLARTGHAHPGRAEILASQPTDWRAVAAQLAGPVPDGKPVFYQKHMAHHLLPEVGRAWLEAPAFRHAFLVREPAAMLASLARVLGPQIGLAAIRVADTGLPQQFELFRRIAERDGRPPPVVRARDVLDNPPGLLRALCRALGVDFDPAMLAWAPGPRPTDGVWARHWYAAVERSAGFAPPRPAPRTPPPELDGVRAACAACYAELVAYRLRA